MSLHIISFGQTGYYFDIANDLLTRIKSRYPHAYINCYSDKDLDSEILEYASKFKRGYGYWQWKPYIIQNHLKILTHGDVLLYLDGRTHFKAKTIAWLDDFIENDADIVTLSSGPREFEYTTQKIFKYFNVNYLEEVFSTPQFFAGVVCLKKSANTVKLINDWNYHLRESSHLFRDEDNNDVDNFSDFIENRHDQSAYSILLKLNKNLVYYDVSSRLNDKQSVIIQFKIHKRWYAKLVNHSRNILPKSIFALILKIYLFLKVKYFKNK